MHLWELILTEQRFLKHLQGSHAQAVTANRAQELKQVSNVSSYSIEPISFRMLFVAKYVSSEKLRKLAREILLFPTLCFTITQLHSNSLIHNSSVHDVRCVIDYLIECDLVDCVRKGVKTTRKSTAVFVKHLPYCDEAGDVDVDQKTIFQEKLEEFSCTDGTLNIDEYVRRNSVIQLDAVGNVTEDLVGFFALQEYVRIDLSPMYQLKEKG